MNARHAGACGRSSPPMWRSWFTLQLGCAVQHGTAHALVTNGMSILWGTKSSQHGYKPLSYGSKTLVAFKIAGIYGCSSHQNLVSCAQLQHAQHAQHAETVVVGETLAELEEAKWRIQQCRVQIWQVRRCKWMNHGMNSGEWEKVKDPNSIISIS